MDDEKMGVREETAVDGELESGSVGLGEDGTVTFAKDFFDDDFGPFAETEPEAEPEPEPEPEPVYYTPQEMADAFGSGSVDLEKLRPDVRDYYNAIMARQPETPKVERPMPVPMPAPQPVDLGALREAGKKVAAQLYLNIPEGDFDEFNPEHQQAQQIAMMEIRDRALAMNRQHMAQLQEAHAAMAQAERLKVDYQRTYEAFGRENADIDMRALDSFYGEWRSGLTVKDAAEVDAALKSGDLGKVRMVMSRMANDYRSRAKGGGGTAQATKEARPAAKAPPKVEGSGGGEAKDEAGVMDISKLGEMSLDEQADMLLKLKIV